MSKRLIFLGPPGAGKGTQAQKLAEQAQIPHISTGQILRDAIAAATALGKKAQAYMDSGDLVPDALLLDLVRERLQQDDAQDGWILDGFPRTVAQAEFLTDLLDDLQQNSAIAITLEVPEEVLVERLLARKRQDDTESTIRRRLEVYRQQTAPVIDFYRTHNLHAVDGDRPPEEVFQTLKALVSAP